MSKTKEPMRGLEIEGSFANEGHMSEMKPFPSTHILRCRASVKTFQHPEKKTLPAELDDITVFLFGRRKLHKASPNVGKIQITSMMF